MGTAGEAGNEYQHDLVLRLGPARSTISPDISQLVRGQRLAEGPPDQPGPVGPRRRVDHAESLEVKDLPALVRQFHLHDRPRLDPVGEDDPNPGSRQVVRSGRMELTGNVHRDR